MFCNVMSDVNLSQVIRTPTRITDTSSSLIDVILVSNPNVSENGLLNTPVCAFDHSIMLKGAI